MPRFLRITDSSGNICLQCILFEQKINLKGLTNISSRGLSVFKKTWRWNYGPISSSIKVQDFFFQFLSKERKNYIGTTHPLCDIKNCSLSKKRWSTSLINLQLSEDELFKSFDKKSAQKNIHRSKERGVTIEEINEDSLHEYHELLNQMRKKSGSKQYDFDYTLDFWKFLKPVGYSCFLARKDGKPVGGLSFSFFNNYINELGVARSEQDFEEKLYSQDLIKWNIIKWGKSHKCIFYDLSGYNPKPDSSKEEGIMRYKQKWGGTPHDFWIINHHQ